MSDKILRADILRLRDSPEVPRPRLTNIQSLPEFDGWDSQGAIEIAIVFEYLHAWKEWHKKYSCPLKINFQIFQPAKVFCERIFLPFRWYVRWCAQRLGRFPQPWELNFKWLQQEIEDEWQEVKQTQVVTEDDNSWQIRLILKAHDKE